MYEQDNSKVCFDCGCNNLKEKKQKRCCIDIIIFVLGILFAATIGLIVGSLPDVAPTLNGALATLIILAIILFILIIIRAVEFICDKCKNYRC